MTILVAFFLCVTFFRGGLGLEQQVQSQAPTASSFGRTIEVPLDYKNPVLGKASLYYEFGAAFDKTKPVVFIIADGQQFYLTRGSVANLQKTIFGNDFNVVGIVGRGFSPQFTQAALNDSGYPDWLKAWQIFNGARRT